MENSDKLIVMKVGGSLLYKNGSLDFDMAYVRKLRSFFIDLSHNHYRFVIAVGGGRLARKYQHDLKTSGEKDIEDLHKVGIAATNLNAEIMHGILSDIATKELLRYNRFEALVTGEADINWEDRCVQLISPSEPGKSNDWNALQVALRFEVSRVYDLKNVDGVYTSDPKSDPHAQKLHNISWDEYLTVIGNPSEHFPGASYPVDPLTARLAKEKGAEFAVVDGGELDALTMLIRSRHHAGTIIHP